MRRARRADRRRPRARARAADRARAAGAAVHLPDEGIVDPMRLTVAFARLAAANGCDVRRGAPVTALEREDGGRTRARRRRTARCARASSSTRRAPRPATVSRLAGGEPFAVWPRKGQYVLLDREFGRRLRSIVFSTPAARHQGRQRRARRRTAPACSARRPPTTTTRATPPPTRTTLAGLRASAARLVPASAAGRADQGVRREPAGERRALRLRLDARVDWLLHATNRSTGVSTAPAAAELALELLRERGLDAADRAGAVRALPAVPRLRTARRARAA